MERYKFSQDIKREVTQLCVLNNHSGFLAIGLDFLVIAAAVLLAEANSYFYPVAFLIIGSRQRALATILHESAHGTLAKNKLMNRILGTYLSGYLIFQTWDSYKKSHVQKHHHKLGQATVDPDYKYYLDSGVYDDQTRNRFIWHYLAKPLLFLNVFSSLHYLVKNRLLSKGCRKELLPMILSLACLACLGGILVNEQFFIIYWIIPFFTSFQMFTWFIELAEHYPMVKTATNDISATRNRFSHAIEHFFTGMHNEHFHLVHHLFPGVPFWRMKQAHQILLRDDKYARINAESGGIFLSGAELKWAN